MTSLIVGASRSGFSLSLALLNSSNKVRIDENVKYHPLTLEMFRSLREGLIDHLNKLVESAKLVWLIRDPLNAASAYVKHFDIPIGEALEYWYFTNVACWYVYSTMPPEARLLLKFEDILLSKKKVSNLFAFLNIDFHDQYLRYLDFDQPHINDEVFQSGKIDLEKVDSYPKSEALLSNWKKYKDTEMVIATRYNT